jgi:hypothetical protein
MAKEKAGRKMKRVNQGSKRSEKGANWSSTSNILITPHHYFNITLYTI